MWWFTSKKCSKEKEAAILIFFCFLCFPFQGNNQTFFSLFFICYPYFPLFLSHLLFLQGNTTLGNSKTHPLALACQHLGKRRLQMFAETLIKWPCFKRISKEDLICCQKSASLYSDQCFVWANKFLKKSSKSNRTDY